MTTQRSRSIDLAKRREAAARNRIDHRTLDKAIDEGPDAIRGGMSRDAARRALAELGLASEPPPPPAGRV